MKRIWVLGLMLLGQPCRVLSADLLKTSFEDMRSPVVPVNYQTVPGPNYVDPDKLPLPNLRDDQIAALTRRLRMIGKKRGKRRAFNSDHAKRLKQDLAKIDRYLVEPIPGWQWDILLTSMGDGARGSYAAFGGDWHLIMDQMFRKLAGDINERYSTFMDAPQYERFKKGSLAGIGVSLIKNVSDQGALVEWIVPDSSAERGGLREEDVIMTLNGKAVSGLDQDQVYDMFRGPGGSAVRLGILRGGMPLREPLVLTRETLNAGDVFSRMLTDSIGYVYLRKFNPDSDDRLITRISELRKDNNMKKLVLDLRCNNGGHSRSAYRIASEFLRRGEIVATLKKGDKIIETIVAQEDGLFSDIPLIVLVDNGARSSGEILAGALKDNRPAPALIGSPTYGKGRTQGVYANPWGRALILSDSEVYTPSGQPIQAQGIAPDIAVDLSRREERDLCDQTYRDLNDKPLKRSRLTDAARDKAVEILSRQPDRFIDVTASGAPAR